MKKKNDLPAAVLACILLLTGCGAVRTEPLWEEPPPAGGSIAYVPLDDRPDNVERVVYLAESLGYVLELPESDLYCTRLDGQPLNENGTQYGDRAALFQWVLEREAAGCDRYILSLDQLLSGGLVQSRCETGEAPIRLSDGRSLSGRQLLEELLGVLSADPSNHVWLLDSVMRLAPTVGYAGGDTETYQWIRDFGMLARPTLTGANLTVDHILQNYWETDWEPFYDEVVEKLGVSGTDYYRPFQDLAANLEARERKLLLTDETQRILARPDYKNFRLLIGIDDSSAEECIQKNEIAYLRQGLRAGPDGQQWDWLLSGVDDLAFKAVAKLYLEENTWSGSAAVQYFGGTEDQPACAYDFQPLTEVMAEHFDFFRLTENTNPLAAQLQILVLTQPAEEAQGSAYFTQLIDILQDCRSKNLPVILVDASNNRYGTAFHDALTREAELGWLLSYAGFLDMAIVTGTALSHGVARYAFLQNGRATEASERAFVRTLADSIVKDFCYRNVVREDLAAYVREAGGDPNNFWMPSIPRDEILNRLEQGMSDVTPAVLKNLERSNFISSLAPYAERGWGGVALENYRFPWDRVFEAGMDIRLGEFTEPHRSVLGFYVQ